MEHTHKKRSKPASNENEWENVNRIVCFRWVGHFDNDNDDASTTTLHSVASQDDDGPDGSDVV